jgi:hypothetical protein
MVVDRSWVWNFAAKTAVDRSWAGNLATSAAPILRAERAAASREKAPALESS